MNSYPLMCAYLFLSLAKCKERFKTRARVAQLEKSIFTPFVVLLFATHRPFSRTGCAMFEDVKYRRACERTGCSRIEKQIFCGYLSSGLKYLPRHMLLARTSCSMWFVPIYALHNTQINVAELDVVLLDELARIKNANSLSDFK